MAFCTPITGVDSEVGLCDNPLIVINCISVIMAHDIVTVIPAVSCEEPLPLCTHVHVYRLAMSILEKDTLILSHLL